MRIQTLCVVCLLTFVCALLADPPSLSDYIRQFRKDNPELAHWSDEGILDSYAEKVGDDPAHPALVEWAKKQVRQREARLAADNKWEARSILPWEKPPLAVSFTRKYMAWQGSSASMLPVVVLTNKAKKPISAIEVMYRIDGVLSRRLVCEKMEAGEARVFVYTEIFGQQRVFERVVRFVCEGYRGSVDVLADFPDP